MRLTLFLAAASLATPALSETRTFSVGPFRSIANQSSPDVQVQVGAAPSVRAEGEASALAMLDVTVADDELVVRTRPGMSWQRGRNRAIVYVTVPSLAAARVEGSGDLRVDRVTGTAFDGSAHGSGGLTVDDLRSETANLSSHGSGNVVAAGSVRSLTAFASGSGNVDARRVQAQTANVRATGSGNVQAIASESAEVRATGSGNATVAGTRTCRVRSTGSGSVSCG